MSRAFIHSVFTAAVSGAAVFNPLSVVAEDLPTVVVSAARTEQSLLSISSDIKIITREQIANSAASSVADVLRRHAGLVVSDQYGDGSRVGVGVRGFGESANANTLVLVDGRRLNNPDLADADIYSIPLSDIERIEVVHGSAGVLFGDQAVGGVINIITSDATKTVNRLDLAYGSYDRKDISGRFSGPITDQVSYKLIVEDRASENYRDHNEKDFQQLNGHLAYRYDQGSVYGEFQYADDRLQTPGPLFQSDVDANRRQTLAAYQADFSNLKTNSGRVGLRHAFSDSWSTEAEVTTRRSDGVFRLSSATAPATDNAYQDREVHEFTPRFIGSLPFNGRHMLITIGMDRVRSDYRLSSIFGDQLNDQEMLAEYVQAVVPVSQKTDVTLGFRHAEVDNELRDTGAFALYPAGRQVDHDVNVGELGVKHRLSDSLSVFARIDENYRFAKVDEYMQPAFSPSFEIILPKTQTGTSYEMGVDWLAGNSGFRVSIYQLDLENEIIYDPDTFANINIDSTQRRGILLDVFDELSGGVVAGVSISAVDAEVETGDFVGREIPYVPRTQADAYVDIDVTDAVNLSLEVQYTDERVISGDFNNDLQKLPSFTVVNLAATYRQKNISYRLRVNNLFDRQYSEFGVASYNPVPVADEAYFPSPERNLMLSASIGF